MGNVTHRQLRNDGLNHLTIPGIRLAYHPYPHGINLRKDPIQPTVIGDKDMLHDKWWSFPDAQYKSRKVGDTVIWEYSQEYASGQTPDERRLYIDLYSSPREKIKQLFGG